MKRSPKDVTIMATNQTKPVYLVTYRGKWAKAQGEPAVMAFGTVDDANDFIDREVKRLHTSRRRFHVHQFVHQEV